LYRDRYAMEILPFRCVDVILLGCVLKILLRKNDNAV
jgi:hypothetical protein